MNQSVQGMSTNGNMSRIPNENKNYINDNIKDPIGKLNELKQMLELRFISEEEYAEKIKEIQSQVNKDKMDYVNISAPSQQVYSQYTNAYYYENSPIPKWIKWVIIIPVALIIFITFSFVLMYNF